MVDVEMSLVLLMTMTMTMIVIMTVIHFRLLKTEMTERICTSTLVLYTVLAPFVCNSILGWL